MRVLVSGATGFIGRALCAELLRAGHSVSALVRDRARAQAVLPSEIELRPTGDLSPESLREAISGHEGIINLAGEPLFPGRWTKSRKQSFESSRVGLTSALVEALRTLEPKPEVLVSASAIGYYGDRADEWLSEQSSPGADYLARLCERWEAAALEAERFGLRVAIARIGLVLGQEGGVLGQMLLPFRLGMGGRLSRGEQFMSWIHRTDLLRLLETMLRDARYRGPVNAVGPAPVTNREFTRALAAALHRPALVPVPAAALRLAFGEAATAILSSQRVEPRVAKQHQFEFEYATLDAALSALELRA